MKKMVKHGLWAPLLGAILVSAGCMTALDTETGDDFADGLDTGGSSPELESPDEGAVAAGASSPLEPGVSDCLGAGAASASGTAGSSESCNTTLSNVATFVSQSVPATMVGGQKYMVSITMRNDGTATWNRDGANPYRLGSQPQDTQLWVTPRVLLPVASVTPGGLATFSFEVTAPSTPGTYDFQWRMVQELVQWFGPVTPKVAVVVTEGVPPLYSGFYLRNWPTGDGRTQWSDLLVSNPNGAPALVTIRVHKRTGGLHAVVQQTIAARGAWNSYGQPAWLNIPSTDPGASLGWIEVGSDRPVIATQRTVIRTGNAYNSPVALLQDDVLSPERSTTLYAPFYLKNWPTGDSPAKTQWSDLLLVNPSHDSAATVTIKVNKVDGTGLLGSLTQSIAPGATFNTYGLPVWLNMPNASPGLGWVEVTSDRRVVGVNRVTVRNGSTYNAPTVLFQDTAMSGKLETVLGSSQYFKDWDVAGVGTESSYPIVVNPGGSPAEVEVRIYREDFSSETFYKSIPARGSWNLFSETAWKDMPAARGWVSVFSSSPVFGVNRKTHLNGSTLAGLDDALLTIPFTSAGYATPYLRSSPFGVGSTSTEWTDVVVSNPQRGATTFTLNVHVNGVTTTFQKSIRAFERWDSSTDPDWLGFVTGPTSVGWLELIPSGPVRATNRVTLRAGTTYYAPIVSFHDVELVPTQP